MTNQDIAKLLREIAASYVIKNEAKFRFQIIAYQRAADAIENTTSQLRNLYEENKLDSLPGVGTTIKSHLEELFKKGHVGHFEWVKKDIPESVFTLLDVPSFGPKKAYKLVNEFSLNNKDTVIDDLEKIAKKGKIAKLDGFGEKSEQDILKVISEFKLGRVKKNRMTLPLASEIAEKVVNYLKKSKHAIQVYPLGSLRRAVSTIGDVDLAVATNNPKEIIHHFTSFPEAERIIEKGPATASILAFGGKQIDLMTQPPEGFGSLLQHFTGSKSHNIALREYALKKGLSLSEHGIKRKVNEKLITENHSSEEDFYKAVGMDWIPPEIRENQGEIELAIGHKLPKLIKLKDIKGDLHIHSSFPIEPSHDAGRNEMQEMINKAKELKYEYIGFSEHNPSVSKHSNKDIYSILARRNEHIEQLKKSNKDVRIINLLEVDILANGDLGVDDKTLELLDAILVGIHSSFALDKIEMTKRIINGLSHPKAKIFAHPTGRILNQRNGYDVDWEKLYEFCKKNHKSLEINAWPGRLDLPDTQVKDAINHDVKLIINTDSHEVSQMDLMKYGVEVARRGWATKNDILNCLEYNKFIEWLKS